VAIEHLTGTHGLHGHTSLAARSLERKLLTRMIPFLETLNGSLPARDPTAAPEPDADSIDDGVLDRQRDALEDEAAVALRDRYSRHRWEHVREVRFALWKGWLKIPPRG